MQSADLETRDAVTLLSRLMPTRSPAFFLAWYIEENAQNGEATWRTDNNPFNLSTPHGEPVPPKPWFLGVESVQTNDVVVFSHALYGIMGTYQFIREAFPHVLTAKTDEEACLALGEPGVYGHWSTNPNYATELIDILREINTPAQAVGQKTVTVEPGDTLSKIAERVGLGADWGYLAKANNIKWPFVIDVGQVLRY